MKKINETSHIASIISASWQKISLFWPLKNFVAVNPLHGLENLPIEQAVVDGAVFFQQNDIPEPVEIVNRETIKWAQAFFDEGQATIQMPLRSEGLYEAFRKLVCFDSRLHEDSIEKKKWLLALPPSSEEAIAECLMRLGIPDKDHILFLTLILTTLPGWSAYVKYRADWAADELYPYPVTKADYLAVRLIIVNLIWPDAYDLIAWHEKKQEQELKKISPLQEIKKAEIEYLLPLAKALASSDLPEKQGVPLAQLLFCIDVRSEPFRKALESKGDYETFGVAGFFGIPVRIDNSITGESHASCPIFFKPKHVVKEIPFCLDKRTHQNIQGYRVLTIFSTLYQSLKYTFSAPFVLAELLGVASGFRMALRTLLPVFSTTLKNSLLQAIRPNIAMVDSLEDITIQEQCIYAEGLLRLIGLTKNFAPLVLLCGHGSTTQNNAFRAALDCGACGGRHGGGNARILASILNNEKVREYLSLKGIVIPSTTNFIGAEHTTTTDSVEMYLSDTYDAGTLKKINQLKIDLEAARKTNSQWRAKEMGFYGDQDKSAHHTESLSMDWAQVRPEWGLARNASFIVAPRGMSKKIDLEGRAFLHSYDYFQDVDGSVLTTILTAPMVVAQWINSQYFFSTLDNVAYGSGSKITANIVGKIGVMQGNASDLMHGLPLQSVYINDTKAYHKPLRLMTIIYAPCIFIDKIIQQQQVLQKLFGNGWVTVVSIDPHNSNHYYLLNRDLTWQKVNE